MPTYQNLHTQQVATYDAPVARFEQSDRWERLDGEDTMPTYTHTSGETVTTVPGSGEDERLAKSDAWTPKEAASGPADGPTEDATPDRPAKSDSKAEWRSYAASLGVDGLDDMTKAEIVEAVEQTEGASDGARVRDSE